MRYEEVHSKIKEIFYVKNTAYIGPDQSDQLRNFRESAEKLGIPISKVIMQRILEKNNRISNQIKHGLDGGDEKIIDDARDLANYSIFLVMALSEELTQPQQLSFFDTVLTVEELNKIRSFSDVNFDINHLD